MDVVNDVLSAAKEHWILVTVLSLLILVYWHYLVNFTTLKKLGIKGPTPLPLIGNTLTTILHRSNFHEFLRDARKKYGKIYGLYMSKTPAILVSDTDIIKAVLVKEFQNFHDRPSLGMEAPEPLASLLTSVSGQRWKDIRSILTPAFTSGKLKNMIYIMNEAGDVLLSKIEKAAEEKEVVDIHQWQQLVTMEVILSAAFGVKSEAQLDPDDKMMSHARRAMTPRPFASLASLIPIVGKKLFKKLILSSWGLNWMHIIEFAQLVIKGRKEDVANSRNDVLQNMLNAQNPERKGHKLTDNELIAQMVLFIIAGYDTSSNTLAFTCYHFAIHPEIQEKVVEEISRVCQSPDGTTYDEIKDMPYLEACINETLRLYPPGFVLSRAVSKSCTINGVEFKKGMGVFIPTYSLHRDEEFWPEPDSFKPERFLPENKDSINQFAYLPFGAGPRNCIGMRFAMMEIKTILVRMLQKYRLVRGPETPVPLKILPKVVLAPAEPVNIRFEKRN